MGNQTDAKRITNDSDKLVNRQSLHDFAAMALDCLDAELQPGGDVPGPVTLGHQSQNLQLSASQRSQWLADGHRVGNGRREATEVGLQDEIFRSRAKTRH